MGESLVESLLGLTFLVSAGERQTVFQAEELVAARLLVFDGKAHEIFRRGAGFPIHGDKRHAVAAVKFQ